jgi:tellurite resistance-related uncharacterized protein
MKRIDIETLRQLAVKNPTAWHQLISAGQLEPNFKVLVIEESVESKILNGQSLPVIQLKSEAKPKVRSPSEIAHIKAICADCSWNVNWICEHPGCKPCRQRRAGGLKRLILDDGTRCPAGKWV